MDPRLQRRVQRYGWDKAASHYQGFWQTQLAPAQTRLLALADIREGESVLDVACGTGLVTFPAAARAGNHGKVVGVDISERMVELATEEARSRTLENVAFERMEAEDLKIADGSFDVVLCALGLMYVTDAAKALTEMRRVLKPGGRAVAAVWGQRDRCGWAEIFPIVDARVKSEVCPLFFALGTADRLRATFEAVGFTSVLSERIASRLEYRSDDEACGAAFVGGPVALAYSRFDEQARTGVHGEYLASIAPYRTGAGYAVPGEFVVTKGQNSIAGP